MNIGEKLRNLRLGQNMTQAELANKLGLTKGYISQIENDLTSPSMQSFFAILEALGTNVKEFFSPEGNMKVVYKKENYEVIEDVNLKHIYTKLIPNDLKYQMGPILLEIKPGGQSKISHAQSGEVFGYVLEGQILLVLNQRRYVLRKGESFYYFANQEHVVMNQSFENAKILWVSTPPML
jgi:transcriptional regulator with XRE-family HTH domain